MSNTETDEVTWVLIMMNVSHGLLQYTGQHAGCAAKANPIILNDLLDDLASVIGTDLPKGSFLKLDNRDDVGIFPIVDSQSIVMNIDAITPIVDDPYAFGRIAVSHALGDIYAKGLHPLFAMNLLAFPFKFAPIELARKILEGAVAQLHEAHSIMLGGHTIEDDEPKLGLAVISMSPVDKIIKKSPLQVGDKLVLTKKLGTGVVATALKKRPDRLSSATLTEVTESMITLNNIAAQIIGEIEVRACTDVTGFGFAVHLYEMIRMTGNVSARVFLDTIPVFEGVIDILKGNIAPQNLHHNMDYLMLKMGAIRLDQPIASHSSFEVLFDPQTSGGLLISVPQDKLDALIDRLVQSNVKFAIVGEVIEQQDDELISFV